MAHELTWYTDFIDWLVYLKIDRFAYRLIYLLINKLIATFSVYLIDSDVK